MASTLEGCTGGFVGLPLRPAIAARLAYLSLNACFIVVNLLFGYLVYESTKSLTVEVDFLSFGCEMLAVIINIVIEVVKRKSPSVRNILMLDLIGAISSLTLLLVIGFVGVYSAITTTEILAKGGSGTPSRYPEEILQYSSFSLCLSVINLIVFAYLKNQMLPEDGIAHDQLNILSNLAHSLVDFVSNFAVLGTSIWLQFGVQEANWFEMRKHKVWVDVFGSFCICACILISICWLLRDIFQAAVYIRELPSSEESQGLKSTGDAVGSTGYGAMKECATP